MVESAYFIELFFLSLLTPLLFTLILLNVFILLLNLILLILILLFSIAILLFLFHTFLMNFINFVNLYIPYLFLFIFLETLTFPLTVMFKNFQNSYPLLIYFNTVTFLLTAVVILLTFLFPLLQKFLIFSLNPFIIQTIFISLKLHFTTPPCSQFLNIVKRSWSSFDISKFCTQFTAFAFPSDSLTDVDAFLTAFNFAVSFILGSLAPYKTFTYRLSSKKSSLV